MRPPPDVERSGLTTILSGSLKPFRSGTFTGDQAGRRGRSRS